MKKRLILLKEFIMVYKKEYNLYYMCFSWRFIAHARGLPYQNHLTLLVISQVVE